MATGGLYGSSLSGTLIAQPGTDSVGLYGSSIPYGGTYFEWFIFQQSATAPATPTGGSWNFTTNVGTPPTGWTQTPPVSPTNIVWVSIAFVNSKTGSTFTWSAPATWVQLGTSGFSGYSGKSGYSGYSGTNGASGTSGYSGTNGASGTSGYSGYSGYSGSGISGYSGYSGSGTSGYSGFSGISGFSGAVGTSGYSGISGANGASGTSGYSGYSGSGISGFSGYSGFSGAPGSGAGTVTSVGMTVPSFMSVSGTPITSSGTLAVSATTTGANSIVLRDTNQNISANSITEGFSSVAAAGTTTTLTVGSAPNFVVTGSGGQTYKLPDATTLANGVNYTFNNNQSSGTIVVTNNSGTTIATIQSGGFVEVILLSNATVAGSWDVHNFAPSNVSWSTNTLDYAGSITSATWNGNTVAVNRGGTGLTSFTSGGVLYASSTSALATGSALTFDGTNFATTGSATATRFVPSGSTVATNGMYLPAANSLGFSTNSTNAIYVDSTQQVGIGGTPVAGRNLTVNKALTGSINSVSFQNNPTIQSDVTSSAYFYNSVPSTTASSFTLTTLVGYRAAQGTFGVGSTVTQQIGFLAESVLTGATNNFGFYGNLTSGTGRYNLYMTGTADNYVNGFLGIGATSAAGYVNLVAGKNLVGGGGTNAFSISQFGTVQSDVTGAVQGFRNVATTAASAFTLSSYTHYQATQGTIGSGSSISTQIGFGVDNSLTGATNNLGFYGAIASGTGRYNLYMTGTADNYLAGKLGLATAPGATVNAIQIANNITGGTTAYLNYAQSSAQSDVTSLAAGYTTVLGTAASSFTLTSLQHYRIAQGTIGAGSTVTNQFGVYVDGSLTGATNNYGFYGNIASGTGRYNLYMAGTADNYLAGKLGVGTTSLTDTQLRIGSNMTGGSGYSTGVSYTGTIQSDVVLRADVFSSFPATQATAFTATNINHFFASSTTIGSGSTVTNQYGFNASSGLTGATNNYGFFGNIANGTGRFNLYMNSTADNYMAGNLTVGPLVTTGVGVSTGSASIELGGSRTGDGVSYIDIHATTGTDYESRIIRGSGANGAFQLINNGTGDFQLQAAGAATMTFLTSATERMRITSAGNVGIATISPGSALDVKGTLRLSGATSGYVGLAPAAAAGSTTYTLPSADGTSGQVLSTNGSGTLSWATGGGGGSAATPTALGTVYASTTSTNTDIVAFGYQAGNSSTGSYSTAIGYQTMVTNSAAYNTAIGYQSLQNPTGGRNVAIGRTVLQGNTSGSFNVGIGGANTLGSNTTGANNVAIGDSALGSNTSGGLNTALGVSALQANTTANYNTAVGYQAGYGITTGSNNTYIGYAATQSGVAVTGELVLTTASATGKGSNTGFIYAGGGGTYQGNNSAAWSVTSDQRLKKNIVDNTIGLSAINAIQVRNFEYRTEDEVTDLPKNQAIAKQGVQLGVIAQELQQVLPDCVKLESTGVLAVDSTDIMYHMINAIKELNAEIQALKSKVGI